MSPQTAAFERALALVEQLKQEPLAADADPLDLYFAYRLLLGRVPEPTGWQTWVAAVERGMTRAAIVANIAASEEFQQRHASAVLHDALRAGTSAREEVGPDGIPIPSATLRKWVAGIPDLDWFIEGGRRAATTVTATLARHGIRFDTLDAILDFGCGCGRVLRHLGGHRNVRLHGTDYNRLAIAWCDEHLGFGEFGTNALSPPTRYREGTFDLVYAFSVFTHLPEPVQLAWMAEFRRIVRRGGHILLSLHGDRYAAKLPPELLSEYRAGRGVVTGDDEAALNVCSAYHPETFVRNVLARGLEVVEFVPEGALGNPYQDLYLIRVPQSV